MIKNITSLILILSTTLVQAQIFSEDFNSGIPPTFTLTDVDGLTPNILVSQFAGSFVACQLSGEYCAGSTSYFTPAGTADDWMVTPAINLPNTLGILALEFDAVVQNIGFPDGVEVYISTTGSTPSDFTGNAIYNTTNSGENGQWTRRRLDITAYYGQTIYIAFRNHSYNQEVLGIDNIMVKELLNNDIELTSLNINPYLVPTSIIDIEGTVTNIGGDTINSMEITWTDGTNSFTDNQTGLNIPPFSNYNFNHSDQLNVTSLVSTNITVSIDNVNGAIDPDTSNNSLTKIAYSVSFIPTKRVVFEESAGTWCPWCPEGIVAMEALVVNFPNTAIGIVVHNADQMTVTAYDAAMDVSVWPSAHIDRAILDVGASNVNEADFMQFYAERINVISPVEINATASFDSVSRIINIDLEAEFIINLNGDYRFNAVILEDGVGPYNQANNFVGNIPALVGPISGINFSTSPNPVNILFDNVARAILGGFDGTPNSLPSAITPGGLYNYNYTHTLPNNHNENNIQVVGMVIDNVSGEILNAVSVALSGFTPASWDCVNNACIDPGTGLGQYSSLASCDALCNVTVINENAELEINIYPNPAKENLTIEGEYLAVDIYDIFGKLVLSSQFKKTIDISILSNGIYSLSIYTKGSTIRKKISVAK